MLTVIDRFTTRDGRWEVDNRPYGLTKEAFDKYGSDDIPGKGGASHIFVKVKPGIAVRFYTKDAITPQHEIRNTDMWGWANMNLWKSSAYWPPNVGPWFVYVGGVEVASGLGLPEGLHVSTFLILGEDDAVVPAPPNETLYQLLKDGVEVWSNR